MQTRFAGRVYSGASMASIRLWFGPIAALLLFAGIFAVGLITPGYSHVRQTVSELGEVGSQVKSRSAFYSVSWQHA
jgi:hypothetical protein